jgi:transcriptional regulator with XRE-family HTH domain
VEEIFKRLGRRIRELRIERGFKSQEDFADHCNLHRTFVGHLETGRKDFRLSTLIKVSGALGVTMSELFTPVEGASPPRASCLPFLKADTEAVLREFSALEKAIQRVKRHLAGDVEIERKPKTSKRERKS